MALPVGPSAGTTPRHHPQSVASRSQPAPAFLATFARNIRARPGLASTSRPRDSRG